MSTSSSTATASHSFDEMSVMWRAPHHNRCKL